MMTKTFHYFDPKKNWSRIAPGRRRLCGPEVLQEKFWPALEVDLWTVWGSTSPKLQEVLERHGEKIICPRARHGVCGGSLIVAAQ
jgi:hypothetical protein